MMDVNAAFARPPLVLLVDPVVASRHWMWRAMSQAFGVIEAETARSARQWLARRPDIDALVVQDELPDQSGHELVCDLASQQYPVAARSIVIARPSPDWGRIAQAGLTLVERGDLRALLAKLASWFLARDAGLARALLREAERLRP
jgi:response regulator RpfG family c-di-GMP phosphodiesterase